MHKKLIKKRQYGGNLSPLTSTSIQQGVGYNNALATSIPSAMAPKLPNMSFITPKSAPGSVNLPVTTGVGALKLASNVAKGSGLINGLKGVLGGSVASMGMGMLSSALPNANNDETTNQINAATQSAADVAIMSGNPLAMGIGAGVKGLGIANKALSALTGGATTINNADTVGDKILSSDLLALTPIGLVNSLGKSTVKGSDTSLASGIDVGYQASDAVKGAEYGFVSGLFGGNSKKRARKAAVARVNRENAMKSDAVRQAKKSLQLGQSGAQDTQSRNTQGLQGGVNTNILAAKFGAKLIKTKEILKSLEDKPKNVIPSGALHAHKHNLEGEISELVTDKGIPVISGDLEEDGGTLVLQEGGELEQTAEIEHSEIILHLELTKKLEDLMERYNKSESKKEKDDLAIEAGKILTEEILENTTDNVGII